jgi:hypothetical protein
MRIRDVNLVKAIAIVSNARTRIAAWKKRSTKRL